MKSGSNEVDKDEDVIQYRGAVKSNSVRVKKQLRSAFIAIAVYLLGSFLTYLFVDVGPFHSLWIPFGEIALVLTLIALLAALYYVLLAWGAWSIARATQREFRELLEDRFGQRHLDP